MEKRDKPNELMKSLPNIEPLDDVPADVSLRFHETLTKLAMANSDVKSKKNWLTSTNQFALAASFTLVFALGAVFTLNSGNNSRDSIIISQNQSTKTPESSDIKEDQLLYSGGAGLIPETSNLPIKLSNSAHDYLTIPTGFQSKLGVGKTWNSSGTLEPSTITCLKSLELDESINLIDEGFLGKIEIKAIWMPINSSSWNVYLMDSDCNVLDKKFVRE
jgi:hypothetical protein